MSDTNSSNEPPRDGIDQISTHWSKIQDPVKFVLRYAPAIRGYLGVFLKNPYDTDDVCQAFLLRVVERGIVEPANLHSRFRDYLIAAVRNAALAHLRRRATAPQSGVPLTDVPAKLEEFVFPDETEWVSRWRRVVLAGTWEALENHEREHPESLCHTALRAMVDFPNETSVALAARVGRASGRTVQPETFRKQVSRARRLFAEFLVAETARTLDDPTPRKVEEELIDIGVMKYVQPFLPADWRTSGKLVDPD
jgi:Sigma-70 region 2